MMTASFTQQTPRILHSVIAAVAVLLALAGCSLPDSDSGPADQTPTETHDHSDDIEHHDLTAERLVEWEDYEPVSDTRIRVHFFAGSEHCYGVRSQVHETVERIEIAVIEGELPDAPEVCTLEAREATLVVQLDAPIGERDIVALSDPTLQ